MQAPQDAGCVCTSVADSVRPSWVSSPVGCLGSWGRHDWEPPVGIFDECVCNDLSHASVHWLELRIPRLRLSHRAALLLTQGFPAPKLLLPNADITWQGKELPAPDLLLRVARFSPAKYPPVLEGLSLVKIWSAPAEMARDELLSLLIANTSA